MIVLCLCDYIADCKYCLQLLISVNYFYYWAEDWSPGASSVAQLFRTLLEAEVSSQ